MQEIAAPGQGIGRLTGLGNRVHVFPDLYREGLNALPAHIAIIDRTGLIVLVNRAWTNSPSPMAAIPQRASRSAPITSTFAAARRLAIPVPLLALVTRWRG